MLHPTVALMVIADPYLTGLHAIGIVDHIRGALGFVGRQSLAMQYPDR